MACFIASCTYLLSNAIVEKEAVVVECLSSWLAEQGVRSSIPGLATCILYIGDFLLFSRDIFERLLSDVNSKNNQTQAMVAYE